MGATVNELHVNWKLHLLCPESFKASEVKSGLHIITSVEIQEFTWNDENNEIMAECLETINLSTYECQLVTYLDATKAAWS